MGEWSPSERSKMTTPGTRIFSLFCGLLAIGASVSIFSYILHHGAWFLSGSNAFDRCWHFFLALVLAQLSQSIGDSGYKMSRAAFE